MVAHTPTIPGFGRPRQEDWEFRAFLGYKVSSRLGCATGDPVTNKEE